MSLPKNGMGRKRAVEKERRVLTWLYQWGFSTRRLLAELMDVSVAGQGAFFARLIEAGVLVETPMPLATKERLIGLTKLGADLASTFGVVGRFRRKPPTLGILGHDLTLQLCVIRRLENSLSVSPEWMNATGGKGKSPDAIIEYPDQKLALEVELSHKNNLRVYYNFFCHLRNAKSGLYQKTVYVFTNQVLRDLYESKFRAEEWPVVVADEKQRLRARDDPFRLGEENWHLMEFVVEEGY
jgi:hypothetical protein